MSGEWKPFGLFYQLTEIYPGEELPSAMDIASLINPLEAERIFLDVVRGMSPVGYGRMMQIISYEWYRMDPNGAQISFGTVAELLGGMDRRAFEEAISRDPAFQEDK